MDLPSTPLPRPPPRFIVRIGLALRRALRWVEAQMVPELRLFELLVGVGATKVLGSAARLDLVSRLPASPTELAPSLGVDEDALRRMMRALAHYGVLRRASDGRYHATRVGMGLTAYPGSMKALAEYLSSPANIAAWNGWDDALRTGVSAYGTVHGRSVWEYFDDHPAERDVFFRAMLDLTAIEGPAVAAALPRDIERLCDVGGGSGLLLSEILIRHPKLQGVLLDAPGVVARSKELFAARGVTNRVELIGGSFFDQVPGGCDAYVLKNILHDWDDARCIAILEKVREVGSRVFVVEALLEPDDTAHLAVVADLQMLVVGDEGRERSLAHYTKLMNAAGYRVVTVRQTPTGIALIEGRADS